MVLLDESTAIQDEEADAEETIMTEQNVIDENISIPDQQEAETLSETEKKSKNSKKKKSKYKKKKKLPAVIAPEFVRWERRSTMLSSITMPESLLTEEDRDEVEEKDKSKGAKKKKRKAKKKKKSLPVNPPDSIDFVPEPDFSIRVSNITIPKQVMKDEDGVAGTSHEADWRISEISLARGLEICNDSLLGPL
jgi:hypothetical protein